MTMATTYRLGRNVVDVPTDPQTGEYNPNLFDGAVVDRFSEDVVTDVMRLLLAVFGPVVKHYHGDWVRDAFWLRRLVYSNVKRRRYSKAPWSQTFYWACDDCGTAVGADQDLVRRARGDENVVTITFYLHADKHGRFVMETVIDRFQETPPLEADECRDFAPDECRGEIDHQTRLCKHHDEFRAVIDILCGQASLESPEAVAAEIMAHYRGSVTP